MEMRCFYQKNKRSYVARYSLQELDMAKLRVLGPEDDVARTPLANDRVDMVAQFTRDGKLNFDGSRVQEELREGETEAFVAEPRFELHPDGLLRWVEVYL